MASTFFNQLPLPKPLPKPLVVVVSEAVAAEGGKALIIINRTLGFFPTARAAFTGIRYCTLGRTNDRRMSDRGTNDKRTNYHRTKDRRTHSLVKALRQKKKIVGKGKFGSKQNLAERRI